MHIISCPKFPFQKEKNNHNCFCKSAHLPFYFQQFESYTLLFANHCSLIKQALNRTSTNLRGPVNVRQQKAGTISSDPSALQTRVISERAGDNPPDSLRNSLHTGYFAGVGLHQGINKGQVGRLKTVITHTVS